jgi:tetratricopeptide (TPR) repeat protein
MAGTYHDPHSDLEEGWKHYKRGDHQIALELLQRAATALPDEALAHYRLGFCLRNLRQHAAALESFRTTAALLPQDPWPPFQVAKELTYLGRPREALLQYSVALDKNHRFAEAYNDLGAVLAMLGFYELSAAAYTIFSVLADMAVQVTGGAPIHLKIFEASVTTLKRVLGAKYSQIHESVFAQLGDPEKGEIDLNGFDLLATQIVKAIRRILEEGLQDKEWLLKPDLIAGPWLPFVGTARSMKGQFLLVADLLKGTLLAERQDVRHQAGRVEVILGARVEIVEAPMQDRDQESKRDHLKEALFSPSPRSVPGSEELARSCCIGGVEVLCATGEIIGSCEGVWGCCNRHREGLL